MKTNFVGVGCLVAATMLLAACSGGSESESVSDEEALSLSPLARSYLGKYDFVGQDKNVFHLELKSDGTYFALINTYVLTGKPCAITSCWVPETGVWGVAPTPSVARTCGLFGDIKIPANAPVFTMTPKSKSSARREYAAPLEKNGLLSLYTRTECEGTGAKSLFRDSQVVQGILQRSK